MTTAQYLDSPIPLHPVLGDVENVFAHESSATASRPQATDGWFFWASKLLPIQRRRSMDALFAFWRELKDIADGTEPRSVKRTLLSNWRDEIAHLYASRPQHNVSKGLSEAIYRYGLRRSDFLAIIDGMEMDAQRDIRAPSFAELDRYCEFGAVAIGRLSMRIFGEETSAGERVAAELGRALQFTHTLGNLAKDAARHRLYLPRELLHAQGIFATTPSWVLAQPALSDVCRDLGAIAQRHYAAAEEALAGCPRWKTLPAAVTFGVYRALLHELLKRGWRHLDEPVQIPSWRGLSLVASSRSGSTLTNRTTRSKHPN